ncbi:MAG: formate-dependent phosphoribosylglycinamide formyltransferase [Bacteroidales bacterium]|nr:formate-dependent phosphoribosylglycinamide formyltransferase [Bacteroidales bacterium]MDY4174044.1 formate-dependent phosphoribosylglycinamide formyltransferase [Bacteroidales bacterium]
MKKIMLLGSGELGKEFVIAVKRLGCHVIAVDAYADAPAMQVADECEVMTSMLHGDELDAIVEKHKPDIIVPEIEAIRTERFYDYESRGIQVVPSAKAANVTMNRRAIRDLAAQELGLRTAKYLYAASEEELRKAVGKIGIPCVVKPLMSSSGKGQSYIKAESQIHDAWIAAQGGRGDSNEVIVEGFVKFDYEITLLTVKQADGPTLFCPPISHHQVNGDYHESWIPAHMKEEFLKEAQEMAKKVTDALGGAGIFGVEFFVCQDGVVFSELSPRPHDTGMVTLGHTLNLSEFELHARAVLHLPIAEISLQRPGASAVVLAPDDTFKSPDYVGVDEVLRDAEADVRIFGKPLAKPGRRMGVVLKWGKNGDSPEALKEGARKLADKISVVKGNIG